MSTGMKRFQDIQILRALASSMVILQHLSLTSTLFAKLPGLLTMPFYLGVELFFVISGYVVTRSLFSRDSHAVAFLVRRFYRLTPAIMVFLLFSLVVFTASVAAKKCRNFPGARLILRPLSPLPIRAASDLLPSRS